MMKQAILDFPKQLQWQPEVVNQKKLPRKVLLCGMGGSALAAEVLKNYPKVDVVIHRTYGLPDLSDIAERAVIFSSYSGNTEEVLSGYEQAKERGLNMVVVAAGGTLATLAQQDGLPHVIIPDTGIQPRMATGFGVRALAALLGRDDILEQTASMSFGVEDYDARAQRIAEDLKDFVPVVYASASNASVAQNWKIKFNETGKIPAFYNVIPELNHNEMTGFDVVQASKHLSERFAFVLLSHTDDHPKNKKRMQTLAALLKDRGLKVVEVPLSGDSISERIFTSLALGDWIAWHIAELYGLESEQVPMVEEFKKLIA